MVAQARVSSASRADDPVPLHGSCGEGRTQEALAAVHLEDSLSKEAQRDWLGAYESFRRYAAIREAFLKSQVESLSRATAARLELDRGRPEAGPPRRPDEGLPAQLDGEAGVSKPRAMEDPLTGLSSRRQLEAGVEQLWQRFPQTPLTLLIVDVDHFKRINDTWSHAVGDEVLKAFAGVLRAQSRPQDLLARIGGKEFVVALGGPMSMTRAMLVAERLRAAVEVHDWASLRRGMAVTASIGVTACAPGESLNAALERARAALYDCERGGRNQARCSS
jgi:diguanylate cyclase (GGDEF)-like protein